MHVIKITATVLAALVLGAGIASASSHGNKYVMSGALGGVTYIMYQNHMALYTYGKDEPGFSNCYSECTEKWLPAILDTDTDMPESYTLVERKDGTMQLA